jgi:uncharacterized membrane protein YeaQ/YmgE (transglycosylase-associated protein family)
MDFLLFILLGGIAGWIASLVMRTDESMGLMANIVVGIVGALIGGWLFSIFGGQGVTGFNFYSLFVAVLGAVVLLWVVRMFSRA